MQLAMASPHLSVFTDGSRYQKSYQRFLECTTEHQCMHDFIDNLLPDIMASTVNGKSHLNVIGVGSGSGKNTHLSIGHIQDSDGELDLKMFSALHLKYPEVKVDNEVVEPVLQQINQYSDLVSQTSGLDHIKFNWNNMTIQEFEQQWKEEKRTKKADLIHMFQMLYYVKDVGATVSFFQGLLNKNGKLLISQLTGDSGWAKLEKTYYKEFDGSDVSCLFSDDIKSYLDSKGLTYQSYLLPCQIDITDCFTEGDEGGELMLDFLTEVLNFNKSVSPEMKAEIMEFLRRPDCSVESNGKILLNSDFDMTVVDQLS